MSKFRNVTPEDLPIWKRNEEGEIVGVGGPNGRFPVRPVVALTKYKGPGIAEETSDATEIARITIPGQALGPRGILRITAAFDFIASVTAKTILCTFGGEEIFEQVIDEDDSVESVIVTKMLANDGALDSQIVLDETLAPLGVDTTEDQDLVFTATMEATDETLRVRALLVEILPS